MEDNYELGCTSRIRFVTGFQAGLHFGVVAVAAAQELLVDVVDEDR